MIFSRRKSRQSLTISSRPKRKKFVCARSKGQRVKGQTGKPYPIAPTVAFGRDAACDKLATQVTRDLFLRGQGQSVRMKNCTI